MKNYRIAFVLALVANLVFAIIIIREHQLGGLWRLAMQRIRMETGGPAPSSAVEQAPASGSPAPSTMPEETPLVPVQLSPERLQSIGVKTGQVESKSIEDEIRVTGTVAVDETRLAYVQVRFAGYIQKVFADATYQYIRKGQPLFTIYSPDLVTTEREYLLAKTTQQHLAQSTVAGVAEGARSLLDAAAGRLKQWDVPEREISRLESSGEARQQMEIDSPVSGYIMERNALPNLYVQPETRLYTVADLSTVWVIAEVFQNDLGRIKAGDHAKLLIDAYPNRGFEGRVDFIYPQVDMATRTARVRLIFSNPDLKLTPGMFANVIFKVRMGRQLVIPAGGVLQSGTRQIAFVDHGGGYLEPREIELGARAGDNFVVSKGLKAGEQIVTSANFLIDSESQLQAALGTFVPPPPGAGVASALNAPQADVELTSKPSPPHKGGNIFRVKLADASGAPVPGAEVTVTFLMPAMPAMGMAAKRASATLSDKGGGVYEGSVQLETGGTWQVTILARRNGQTLASKQLSVNAEGGM